RADEGTARYHLLQPQLAESHGTRWRRLPRQSGRCRGLGARRLHGASGGARARVEPRGLRHLTLPMRRLHAFGLQAVALLPCALSIAALTVISVRLEASRSTITPTAARASSAPADACVAPEGEDEERAGAGTSSQIFRVQAVASYCAASSPHLVPIDWQGRFFFSIQRK